MEDPQVTKGFNTKDGRILMVWGYLHFGNLHIVSWPDVTERIECGKLNATNLPWLTGDGL